MGFVDLLSANVSIMQWSPLVCIVLRPGIVTQQQAYSMLTKPYSACVRRKCIRPKELYKLERIRDMNKYSMYIPLYISCHTIS